MDKSVVVANMITWLYLRRKTLHYLNFRAPHCICQQLSSFNGLW